VKILLECEVDEKTPYTLTESFHRRPFGSLGSQGRKVRRVRSNTDPLLKREGEGAARRALCSRGGRLGLVFGSPRQRNARHSHR